MDPAPRRLVAIAVLANNEEERLKETLTAITEQSIIEDRPHEVEIVVVANGCRDNTAEIARHFFRGLESPVANRVVEVTVPGTHFVQEQSPELIGAALADWLGNLNA